MAHSIKVIGNGNRGIEDLPTNFNWPLFVIALFIMMMPVFEAGIQTPKSK